MDWSLDRARRLLLSAIAHAARFEKTTLMVLAAAVLAAWGFVELAEVVMAGETRALDEAILLALRNPADSADPLGPGWFEELVRDFTALGGTAVLTIITLAVFGYLLLDRKQNAALMVIGSVATGLLMSHLLKFGFARPRPDLVPHGANVYTASFPSGHSMLAAVVYLTLGVLLARTLERRVLRFYVLVIAILLTALVGVSRVYLGVHWPTDVLAGWAAGTGWALLCWLVMLLLQERGRIADPGRRAQPAGEDSS
jgi:undecaprenyl-diphosphatase